MNNKPVQTPYLMPETTFFELGEGRYGLTAYIKVKRSDHRVFTIAQVYGLYPDDLEKMARAVEQAFRKINDKDH